MPRPAKARISAAFPLPGLSFGLVSLVVVGALLILDRLV
jgi:hypothetical protein